MHARFEAIVKEDKENKPLIVFALETTDRRVLRCKLSPFHLSALFADHATLPRRPIAVSETELAWILQYDPLLTRHNKIEQLLSSSERERKGNIQIISVHTIGAEIISGADPLSQLILEKISQSEIMAAWRHLRDWNLDREAFEDSVLPSFVCE